MKNGVVVKQLKLSYGPITDAIKKTGIDILGLDDQSKFGEYDNLIVFYNKIPDIKVKPKNKVAWWMNDLRLPTELSQVKSNNFDEIFICHKGFDEQYLNHFRKPIHYMPQCGHSQPMIKGRDINWDISFIGKIDSKRFYHRDRSNLLEELEKCCKVGVISGEGQTKDQHWIYNQSKYNLSVSYPMIEGTSNRLYNILASGGFALVRYYPGMEKQFKNHGHLVWFKTTGEALEIIAYYNKREVKRQLIADNGKKLYLEKHTASHRIENIFDIMINREPKFRGYL